MKQEIFRTRGEPQGKTDEIIIDFVRAKGEITIRSLAQGCFTEKWFGPCAMVIDSTPRQAKKWAAHHVDRLVRDGLLKFRQVKNQRAHVFYIP